MSVRYLRKVLKEQEEQQLKSSVSEVSEEESDSSPDPGTTSRNLFDLLEDQETELDVDVAEQEDVLVKGSSRPIPSANHKSKKKKKKNKDNPPSIQNKDEKPLDLILESLSIGLNPPTGSVNPKSTARFKGQANFVKHSPSSVLAVDPKFLKAENELRRIFGSKVVSSFENNHSGSSRQIHGGRRGSHNHRKTFLVSPSSFWPRWDSSLSMEILEKKDDIQFFRYVHSPSYSQAHRAFEAAKNINDLNGIANILVYYPYHIESLLTIAEVLKFSGEHQSSADAIGKCLFALECAWHSSFSPLHGCCQLKYSHDTNKPIFRALFSHMQNMDRRGCHRSALEVCKLLLSLDSDDPMGAIFCIDYFSLRAEEYSWLERFADEYKSDNSLWLFPNFSYSLAVCRFCLETGASSKDASTQSEKATSTDLMKQALMLHPLILKKLVAKAPLKDPIWSKLLSHSFFGSAKAGSPSLDHLTNIYVERNYLLWRLPHLQKLLKDAAQLVIESLNLNSEARDWACVRKETFSSEKNEYSHLPVSDFSDSIPTMPPDDLRHLMVDPQIAHAMQNGDQAANPESAHGPRDLLNRNPVVVFLESLLPWVDYGANLDVHLLDDRNQDNEE